MASQLYLTKGLNFFYAELATIARANVAFTTTIATPFAVVNNEKYNKKFVLAIQSTCSRNYGVLTTHELIDTNIQQLHLLLVASITLVAKSRFIEV
jgi:hypothetical protein